MPDDSVAVPDALIAAFILLIRGHKVILDRDLAHLYGVSTRVLNQAVKRNLNRFPQDFMFQLTAEETAAWQRIAEVRSRSHDVTVKQAASLRSQNVILKPERLRSQFVTLEEDASKSQSVILKNARGRHIKHRPHAFTEHGILMLSSVLKSERAVEVNIQIMRTFVRLRELLATNSELSRRLDDLERNYDAKFKVVFDAIRSLLSSQDRKTGRIGFRSEP